MKNIDFKNGIQSELKQENLPDIISRVYEDATLHTNIEFKVPISELTHLYLQNRFTNGVTKYSSTRVMINHPNESNRKPVPPAAPAVKTQFLIIGMNETEVLTGASLSSTGISEYKEFCVLGQLIDRVNTLEEAQQIAIQNAYKFEQGCEIKTVYVKS